MVSRQRVLSCASHAPGYNGEMNGINYEYDGDTIIYEPIKSDWLLWIT